jgi:hypothetical protein
MHISEILILRHMSVLFSFSVTHFAYIHSISSHKGFICLDPPPKKNLTYWRIQNETDNTARDFKSTQSKTLLECSQSGPMLECSQSETLLECSQNETLLECSGNETLLECFQRETLLDCLQSETPSLRTLRLCVYADGDR